MRDRLLLILLNADQLPFPHKNAPNLGVVRLGAKFSPINGTEVEHIGEWTKYLPLTAFVFNLEGSAAPQTIIGESESNLKLI